MHEGYRISDPKVVPPRLIKHILVSLQLGVAMFKVVIATEFPRVRKSYGKKYTALFKSTCLI